MVSTRPKPNQTRSRVKKDTVKQEQNSKKKKKKVMVIQKEHLGNCCSWAARDPFMKAYHDTEWGDYSLDPSSVKSDSYLFEMLILEGAQAGLSWSTILAKRENYRLAYKNWDIATVSAFTEEDVKRLLAVDSGIVKNQLKVRASIINAQKVLEIQKNFGSFANYLRQWVNGTGADRKPVVRTKDEPLHAKTEVSDRLSEDLKKRGFKFVGSTIMYAFMQAIGMVSDHDHFCFKHPDNLGGSGSKPL